VITSEEEVTEKFNTIVDELPDKKIEFVPEENIESYYNLYTDLASA
jgi:starch synthase